MKNSKRWTAAALMILVSMINIWVYSMPNHAAEPYRVYVCGLLAFIIVLMWLYFDHRNFKLIKEVKQTNKLLADLRFALDQSAIVAITDTTGKINFVNDKFCEISGYSEDELIGKDHRVINSGHHSREFFVSMWGTISAGKVWHGEIKNRAKNGSFYWVHTTIVPFFDETKKPWRYIAIRWDITNRIEAQVKFEKERLNVFHMQKLEAIGTLASGIAHDFNNILQCFSSGLGLMQNATLLPKEQAILDDLMNITIRGKDLVRQILAFSRKSPKTVKVFSVRSILQVAFSMMKSTLPTNIVIKLVGTEGDFFVRGDENQILQVVINFCTNASYVLKDSGGHIEIGYKPSDAEVISELHSVLDASKEYLVISVKDDGPGIPEDLMPRLFEPFFTTKPVGEGTGMGLAVVHGIILDHHGHVSVGSVPFKATTFSVYLPRVKEAELSEQERASLSGKINPIEVLPPKTPTNRPTILFVDDDIMVRKFQTKMIEDIGYEVLSFEQGQEVLSFLKDSVPGNYLVITDFSMPGMNGFELAKAIKKFKKIPVIVATGNTSIETKDCSEFVDALIEKPFAIFELERAIAKVLNQ